MKAIYTVLNNKVYRIMQNVWAPVSDVERINENTISVKTDVYQKILNTQIYLTDWSSVDALSNKEKADAFLKFLKDEQIKEVNPLIDRFTVSVDYSLYNKDMQQEYEHSVVIKPLKTRDFVFPLGINENNECVYRRFKHLTGDLDWIITDRMPYGIMCHKNKKHIIKINDICIYQDKFEESDDDVHNSIYSQSYNCNSCTINTLLDNKVLVYSSKVAGYDFAPIVNEFNPRIINLNLVVDLTNIVVMYNHKDVDDIISENIAIAHGIEESDDSTSHESSNSNCNCNCNTDTNESGDFTPTYVWRRGTASESLALKVVEDLYPSEQFNSETMVHKSDVIGDIPDIAVDEYVVKTRVT